MVRTAEPALASLSSDKFLGGRVQVSQLSDGPRAGLDAVMLAAAINADSGMQVAELGLGAGVVSLCLDARLPGLKFSGLEKMPAMARLAEQNAHHNGMTIDIVVGDVADPPQSFLARRFDHVFANPPFTEAGTGTSPQEDPRAQAHVAQLPLIHWIATAHAILKTGGVFTMIHRADALPRIMQGFAKGEWGSLQICPLWPRAGAPAKRILLQARKAKKGPLLFLPGLVLHESDGNYTPEAEHILRDAGAIGWE